MEDILKETDCRFAADVKGTKPPVDVDLSLEQIKVNNKMPCPCIYTSASYCVRDSMF